MKYIFHLNYQINLCSLCTDICLTQYTHANCQTWSSLCAHIKILSTNIGNRGGLKLYISNNSSNLQTMTLRRSFCLFFTGSPSSTIKVFNSVKACITLCASLASMYCLLFDYKNISLDSPIITSLLHNVKNYCQLALQGVMVNIYRYSILLIYIE